MKTNKKTNIIWTFPIILGIGIIPLIARTHLYEAHLSGEVWFPDLSETTMDTFLFWKSRFIMGLGIVLIIFMVAGFIRFRKELSGKKIFLFLLISGVFIILSGFFSVNKEFSWNGGYERFEPVPVLITYGLLCVYAYFLIRSWADIKTTLVGVLCGVSLLIFISLMQMAGHDPLMTGGLFGNLTVSQDVLNLGLGLTNTLGVGRVYGTLYNPNYFSMYFVVLFPVICMFFFAVKPIWGKIICVAIAVGLVISYQWTFSKSGWIGLLAGVVLGLFVLFWRNRKGFIIFCSCMGVMAAIALAALPKWANRIGSGQEDHLIEKIDTLDDCVDFTLSEGGSLQFAWEVNDGMLNYGISDPQLFLDLGGTISTHYNEELGDLYFTINLDDQDWMFTHSFDDTYYFINTAGKPAKINNEIENANLFHPGEFSGRGEIWNFSIPLLKDCMIVGKGADTFILDYPQDRYIEKIYKNAINILDAKPHSYYLQMWIENGFIAFLAIMIFFVFYAVNSIRTYARLKKWDSVAFVGYGCFIGVVSNLIVWLSNDSNTCTTIVFWGILGIGMACNRIVKENNADIFQKKEKTLGVTEGMAAVFGKSTLSAETMQNADRESNVSVLKGESGISKSKDTGSEAGNFGDKFSSTKKDRRKRNRGSKK